MQVRGAPLIAIVAALGLSVELHVRRESFGAVEDIVNFILKSADYLRTSRPTAVNLFAATDAIRSKFYL